MYAYVRMHTRVRACVSVHTMISAAWKLFARMASVMRSMIAEKFSRNFWQSGPTITPHQYRCTLTLNSARAALNASSKTPPAPSSVSSCPDSRINSAYLVTSLLNVSISTWSSSASSLSSFAL